MRILIALLALALFALFVGGCAAEPDTITVPEDDGQSAQPNGPDAPVEGPSGNANDTPDQDSQAFCGTSSMGACETDADCVPAGCSSQVCANQDEAGQLMTTCEYRQCYDAGSYGLGCGCVEGQCQWA